MSLNYHQIILPLGAKYMAANILARKRTVHITSKVGNVSFTPVSPTSRETLYSQNVGSQSHRQAKQSDYSLLSCTLCLLSDGLGAAVIWGICIQMPTRISWGLLSRPSTFANGSQMGSREFVPTMLRPHHGMSLGNRKAHSEREAHQQQVAWGENQISHMPAAQFQEPFQRGAKRHGSWVSVVKQAHEGAYPMQHTSLLWKLLVPGFGLVLCCHTEKFCICIILTVCFFLLCEQQIQIRLKWTTFLEISTIYTVNLKDSQNILLIVYAQLFTVKLYLSTYIRVICLHHWKYARAPVQYLIHVESLMHISAFL